MEISQLDQTSGRNNPDSSRDIDLAKELEELKVQYAKEKQQWQDAQDSKNYIIDGCRIKLKRYEFAVKEAILFLSKPVTAHEDWINGRVGGSPLDELNAMLSGAILSSSYGPSRTNEPEPATPNSKSKEFTKDKSASNSSQGQSNIVKPGAAFPAEATTRLEIQAFECMRLALNYLKNAQKSVEAIERGDHDFTKPIPKIVSNPDESLALISTTAVDPPNCPSSVAAKTEVILSLPVKSMRPFSLSQSSPSKSQIDEEEGDLSTTSNTETASPTKTCSNCRTLFLKIDKLHEKIRELEMSTSTLQDKLLDQTRIKERVQQAKEVLDQELEELTAQLFDQANQMVMKESRTRDDLELANKELRNRARDLTDRLQVRETELKEIKKSLYALQSKHINSQSFSTIVPITAEEPSHSSASTHQPDTRNEALQFSHTIIAGFDNFESIIGVDGIIFQEFQEHIKTTMLAASQPPAQGLAATHSTIFMKRCMLEDVEPTLNYTYMPTSAFKAVGSGSTMFFRKRLLESVTKGLCQLKFIEPQDLYTENELAGNGTPPTESPQSINGKLPLGGIISVRERCNVCTAIRDCEYIMRFTTQDKLSNAKPEWFFTCRFCRDRITSVNDFFTYVSSLRQGTVGPGKKGATILSIFKHMLWLKRRMGLSRTGSCALFETELSAITAPGGGGDWEKFIKIMQ